MGNRPRLIDVRLGHFLREQLVGGFAVDLRLLQPAEVGVDLREIAMGENKPRPHPQRDLKCLHRAVIPAATRKDGAELEMRLGKIMP